MARQITSADYFEVDTAPAVNGSPCTINAWFNAPSAGNGPIWVAVDKSSGTRVFGIDLTAGNTRVFERTAGSFLSAQSSSGYTNDKWEMATGVLVTATNRRVFLNGGNTGTDGNTIGSHTGIDRLSIGRFGDSSPTQSNMDFDLAEIAVWNIALSDAEVALLYDAGPRAYSAFFVRPEALVHYWRFLENSITAGITDIIGGLNLAQTSSPAIADHVPLLYPAPRAVWSAPAAAVGGTLHPLVMGSTNLLRGKI